MIDLITHLTLRNFIVIVQILTMLGLAYIFLKDGLWQLAGAQLMYSIATVFIFILTPSD